MALCMNIHSSLLKVKMLVTQSWPTLCDPTDSSPPVLCLWNSSGKNTGVGCWFLLQIVSCGRVYIYDPPYTDGEAKVLSG